MPQCRPTFLWRSALAGSALLLAACAAPMTRMGSVSREEIRMEQLRQQQLVIRSGIADEQRVATVALPLLRAAVPLCGPSATGVQRGVQYANIYSFDKEYRDAARVMGFTDTLTIVGVVPGSAAARSGVQVGDRITQLGDDPVPTGRTAMRKFGQRLGKLNRGHDVVALTLRHGPLALASTPGDVSPGEVPLAGDSSARTPDGAAAVALGDTDTTAQAHAGATSETVRIPADTVCNYTVVAITSSDLNAFSDGHNVYVTSAMLRFAANDDELRVVLSHEIAHNAMRHIDAKKKNSLLGGLLGAVIDVAAASQGVNTGGEFTRDFADAGAMVFSQDFEREADYVGLYILARSNAPFANAPDFWRRMAQATPGSIKFASSHPTTAERFLRLEKTVQEIRDKQAAGAELLPEMKHQDEAHH
ncbi:MAG TPA: M48 family metalloprotease [Gemmatimonadaceae bacterium]|nr:M48 family metalloprotease [Gemmatimonadaceae bacterium]